MAVPVTLKGLLSYDVPGAPGEPTHPIELPPGIWGPNDPRPTPPIVIPPDAVAPGVPTHPIYLPPPRPEHPIVIPPDGLAPGVPTHPIYLPPGIWGPNDPRPDPPIFIPPGAISPGVPAHPIYLPPSIWGPTDPRPSQPIYLPIPVPLPPNDVPAPVQPIGGVPGPGGLLVWYPIPGYGWVGVPAKGGTPQLPKR